MDPASSGWSSCWNGRSPTRCTAATRSTGTWVGRARRRRTRSASGCGWPDATPPVSGTGTDFDLKAFHTAALRMGGMGLDPLAEQLALL